MVQHVKRPELTACNDDINPATRLPAILGAGVVDKDKDHCTPQHADFPQLRSSPKYSFVYREAVASDIHA
jgi:hypothetical protein